VNQPVEGAGNGYEVRRSGEGLGDELAHLFDLY